MTDYAEKLEESVKLLRSKIKAQAKEFDILRLKYVKLASQNKSLYELNERLKDGLKSTKEKLSKYEANPPPKKPTQEGKCKECGCDLFLGFNQAPPSNINIRANNSSFAIRIGGFYFWVSNFN